MKRVRSLPAFLFAIAFILILHLTVNAQEGESESPLTVTLGYNLLNDDDNSCI